MHYRRTVVDVMDERLMDEAVVLLEGPRSVGKSTILRQLAARIGGHVLDLDDPTVRQAVASDPAHYLRGSGPVLIDEYQKLPELLEAIKVELNNDHRPGRFVLTGSTKHDALRGVQALTGRLHRLQARPLSAGELAGTPEAFVERAFCDPAELFAANESGAPRASVIRQLVRGGFPLAVARQGEAARGRWFDDYISVSLARDVQEIAGVRNPRALRRLLERLVAQTAQVVNVSAAAAHVDVSPTVASDYARLLQQIFLLFDLPAWGTTLLSRTQKRPKVHVVDAGLGARLLRVSEAKLNGRDPAVLTDLGHLLESFVVGEVLKQVSWLDHPVDAGHWRTTMGDEVDLVLESGDGSIFAIEVKASGRVRGADFASLAALRRRMGSDFAGGVVLYLGERTFRLDDRLYVAPVSALWADG